MGARLVAARHEWRSLVLDGSQGRGNVVGAADACGIALRADQHKIIVHHVEALRREALLDELLLLRLGMDEHDIGVTAASSVESLTRALSHDLHLDAGLVP